MRAAAALRAFMSSDPIVPVTLSPWYVMHVLEHMAPREFGIEGSQLAVEMQRKALAEAIPDDQETGKFQWKLVAEGVASLLRDSQQTPEQVRWVKAPFLFPGACCFLFLNLGWGV